MSSRATFFALVLIAAVFGAVGDGLANAWVKGKSQLWSLLCGFACINIAFGLFLRLQKYGDYLFYSGTLFFVVNSVILYLISYRFFRERVSPQAWVGIAIIAVGLIVAELGREAK